LSVIYGLTNVFNSNGNIKLRIGLSAWWNIVYAW
jgi:hypothetical protein